MAAFLDYQEQNFAAYASWCLFVLENWLRTHGGRPFVDSGEDITAGSIAS
jgi:hypothetical protein